MANPHPDRRKYQEVWERLKKHKECRLIVPGYLLSRVKKAVSKEKHRDDGFKVLNDMDYFSLSFEYIVDKQELVITLKQKFGLEDMRSTA